MKLRIDQYEEKGERDYMEDRKHVFENENLLIAMVMDGHGGTRSAEECAAALRQATSDADLMKAYIEWPLDARVRFWQDFVSSVDRKIELITEDESGTTLVGVVFHKQENTTLVINLGDSKFFAHVRGRVYKIGIDGTLRLLEEPAQPRQFQTLDHSPKSEESRIKSLGGVVEEDRLMGSLSMSRSIGDFDLQRSMPNVDSGRRKLSASICDVYVMRTTDITWPVVVCSDGITESIAIDKVFELIGKIQERNTEDKDFEAAMVKKALSLGSEDNITCIVIRNQ